jgi:serine protease Do
LLGVVLPPPDSKDRPGKAGAKVEDVMPGSPAAKAKLRPGDFITHVGDQQVQDHQQLIRLVSALPAEAQVTLQVVRDSDSKKTSKQAFPVIVTLSKKYQESAREPFAEVREPAWRGMRVDYATASPVFRELARHVDPEGCVAVIDVEPDSPAWKAGLRGGTFVSHVGKRRVSTPRQFREAVAQQAGEAALHITSAGDGDPVRKVAAP